MKPSYLETDASGVGQGMGSLQTREGTSWSREGIPDNSILRPVTTASKSLWATGKRYSYVEKEVLGILHSLEKFHH